MKPEIIPWLLEGDPSIRWQVQRDLLNPSPAKYELERKKIAKEGWGGAIACFTRSKWTMEWRNLHPKMDIYNLHHADSAPAWSAAE